MSMRRNVWVKASPSDSNGSCVQVLLDPYGMRFIRDSKDPEGHVLGFSAEEWAAFAAGVQAGEFDD